jgi:hypothetical protein
MLGGSIKPTRLAHKKRKQDSLINQITKANHYYPLVISQNKRKFKPK